MRHKYNRGSFDSALTKILGAAIGLPLLFVFAFALLNPGGGTPAPTSPLPPAPPAQPLDPPGLDLCTAQQMAANGMSASDQGADTKNSGEVADPDQWGTWICHNTGQWLCDVTWRSRVMYLCTDRGRSIEALEYIEDSVTLNPNLTGSRYTKDLQLCQGSQCSPFDIVNPRFNCHGDSFGHDEYWIQPNQVQRILDDNYTKIPEPAAEDIVIYRECKLANGASCRKAGETQAQYCERLWTARSGDLVHSATWVGPRSLDMTFGKRGFEPRKRYMPVGPGEDAAWDNPDACVEYYRKS